MSELRGACIIGQSGGPTAVINASALGVIRTALDTDCITRVLGAANGIQGVLEDRLYDMGQEDAGELELLRYTRPPRWAPAATSWLSPARMTPTTAVFSKFSASMMCAISSTTAATTPWTPATKFPSI